MTSTLVEPALFVASVSNGAASSIAHGQLGGHRRLQLHVLEGRRDAAALRHRHRLRLGERRRSEHQRQRRRRADVTVQLGDIGDDVDRPRRQRLRRCVDGRNNEIRPQAGDRSAPELEKLTRRAAPHVHAGADRGAAGNWPELDLRDARRGGDIPQHTDHRPVHRDMDELQRLDGRGGCLSIDLDPEQPALRPRQRADLERVRDRDSGTPCGGHGERDSSRPHYTCEPGRTARHRPCHQREHVVSFVSDSDEGTVRLRAHAALTGN